MKKKIRKHKARHTTACLPDAERVSIDGMFEGGSDMSE